MLLVRHLRPRVLRKWQLYKQFVIQTRTQHATIVAHSTTPDEEPKAAKRNKPVIPEEWKRDVALKLSQELKAEHKRYSLYKRRQLDEHRVVCLMRDQNALSLVLYLQRLIGATHENEIPEYNELFAVSLKHAADYLASNMSSEEWLKSQDTLEFVEKFVDTLNAVPLSSNDIILVYGFSLAQLYKWKSVVPMDVFEDPMPLIYSIDALKMRLHTLSKVTNLRQNGLLFNEKDFRTACDFFGFDPKQSVSEISYLGYDENLKLGKDLFEPCTPEQYNGSPFLLHGMDKETLLKKFRQQLLNEQRICYAVHNYSRNSQDKPMELLIKEWRWDKAIAASLSASLKNTRSLSVKRYLIGLNSNDVADVLLECVLAALCQGNSLIPIDDLEYNMTRAVLALSHRDFVRKSLSESADLFDKISAEYFRYFFEEDLPRTYNLREWWHICARKFNVDPDFHLPFSELSAANDELATFLLSVVMNACRIPAANLSKKNSQHAFSFRNVNIEQEPLLGNILNIRNKAELVKMIEVNFELVDLIGQHQFEDLFFPYHMLPMTLPPRPWMDSGKCGPLFSRSSNVLRNLYEFPDINVNVEMKKRLKSDVQARPAFDALNDLGATAWIINQSMLRQLIVAFDFSFIPEKKDLLKGLAIPMHSSVFDVPLFEDYFGDQKASDISTIEWMEFSKLEHQIKKERNESNSLWCWLMYRIVLANHYRNDVLYFPHNMDFRGRVYPISPHLNHMGDDINRCLLKFARGKPLGERGFNWLKIHCINLTGLLKRKSIDDRLAYAEANMDKILHSANHPWSEGAWWLESEEPWQTLAACMEIRDALNSGRRPEEFVSHLPIHQDGSCNGFQHYAALGRDQQGAMEVNLLPTDVPADIYSNVAARVEKRRVADEKEAEDEKVRELVADLRTHINEPMPRKVIKQTVMTTIYGVTQYGARLQIKKQLKALGIPNEKLVPFASYIAEKTLGSLTEAFEASMKLKDWFRQAARSIGKLHQPVEWVTPLGLPVMQPYIKTGRNMEFLCRNPINSKQVDAFPPNFVHSLDSVHMMLTTLYCRHHGVTFAAVHDCFWTHACDVDLMNKICRDQFIRLHSLPIVEDLGKQFQDVYLDRELLRRMKPEKLENFRESLTPSTKRGTLDIEQIRDSVYFFS